MAIYTAKGRLERAALIERYLPMVRRQALSLSVRLPSSVELEDLIQSGMIGLLDALERFDPSLGTSFPTYASQRVHGAMVDELRSRDWLPRSVRRGYREVERAMRELEQRHGRAASEREIAEYLDMPLEAYRQLIGEVNDGLFSTFNESSEDDQPTSRVDEELAPFVAPDQACLDAEQRKRLHDAIEMLPERERVLLALYYQEQLNLKEVGAVLGVTESRVSQLHSQAVARLRVKLRW